MTDDEFDAFLETCQAELRKKQQDLSDRFDLGAWARWNYDQSTGKLTFHDDSGTLRVEAVATFIGSFAPNTGTWVWGWANTSLLPTVRQRATALQGLAEVTGLKTFREKGARRADEASAGEMVAMAVHHLRALGCYKGPGGSSSVFLSIDEIRRV